MGVLSPALRDALKEGFGGKEGGSGTNAGPGRAAIRGLMRDAVDVGIPDEDVAHLANPAFYRGVNDPFGGGQLLEDLDARTLKALVAYAKLCSGSGLNEHGGSTEAQADFFEAFPDMLAHYQELAG